MPVGGAKAHKHTQQADACAETHTQTHRHMKKMFWAVEQLEQNVKGVSEPIKNLLGRPAHPNVGRRVWGQTCFCACRPAGRQ